MKKYWILYAFLYVLILLLSMGLFPMDDDWRFMSYFAQSENWGIDRVHWPYNCILLPRGFWRPWDDIIFLWESHHVWLHPYFNHFLAVTLSFSTVPSLYRLARKFDIKRHIALLLPLACMIFTNNLAPLFGIDANEQNIAVAFGLLSVNFYNSDVKGKYIWWIISGIIASFGKESGFIYFVAAPVLKYIIELYQNKVTSFKNIDYRRGLKYFGIGLIPAFVYLGSYVVAMQVRKNYFAEDPMKVEKTVHAKEHIDHAENTEDLLTSSQQSHKLTATTFIKNIYILYFASSYPVDTSAIYYKNKLLLGITAILGLSGLLLLVRIFKRQTNDDWVVIAGLLFLMFMISSIALVTRAGELSSFVSNGFLVLTLAFAINKIHWTKVDSLLLGVWFICTLITDIHKYSCAYIGGQSGRSMGQQVKALTKGNPHIVLWVGPDESQLDKAGAAFTKSPYKSFNQGKAAVAAYGYKYPQKIEQVAVPMNKWNKKVCDSIVERNKKLRKYDCIWISEGNKVKVINLK